MYSREKERKKAYLDLRRTVLRKKRKRISRVAITRVPTHPLLLLLLSLSLPSSSSSRCPFVVRPRRRSPFQRRTFFIVAREKDFMKEKDEKKANAEAKKKMCQTEDEKKRRGRFFRPLFFLSFPFQIKILVKESALLSALLRFSFFSLGVFIRRTSRWSRARAYIYIYISRNARSRRVSLERRDEKKREKERKRRARDDDPGGKREEEEERSNRFFGVVVCVRASEDERKRERKQDFPLLFKRFIKGALRAEFSLSLSLSLSLSFVRVCDSSSEYTFLRNTQTRTKTKAKCVLLFLPRRRRSHREEEE